MENVESMEPRIIKTQDENGEIHNFELIDVLHLDDQDYGLLIYLDGKEEEGGEEEEEVIIMKLHKEDDAYTFETIENDEEFNKVVSYLETEGELEFEEEDEEEE
ncbi:MAG: hypothetical protein ACD_20C00363G0007 [uncultured bacterium]|nr:MAG: hypothetical protein ACD_20C00363G0007 [uncultured bacterium]HBH18307.1 hypothetical protein [Cyanobacteria bacterium UBA9579]